MSSCLFRVLSKSQYILELRETQGWIYIRLISSTPYFHILKSVGNWLIVKKTLKDNVRRRKAKKRNIWWKWHFWNWYDYTEIQLFQYFCFLLKPTTLYPCHWLSLRNTSISLKVLLIYIYIFKFYISLFCSHVQAMLNPPILCLYLLWLPCSTSINSISSPLWRFYPN